MKLKHIKLFQAVKVDRESTFVEASEDVSITLEGTLIYIKTPTKCVITSTANMCWAEEVEAKTEKAEKKRGQATSKNNTSGTAKKKRGKAKVE